MINNKKQMIDYLNRVILLKEIDSTNNYLKEKAEKEPLKEGTIVFADMQIAGRGQTGNSWLSNKGQNILESLYLTPDFLPAEYMFSISKFVSIGIVEALNNYYDGFCIKWPNDIYYTNHKIGGILVENKIMGSNISESIIGMGININQSLFDPILPNPISLKNICKKTFDLHAVNKTIIIKIMEWYNILKTGDVNKIDKRYHRLLFRKKGMHQYQSENLLFDAEIQKVESDGKLILKTNQGSKAFYFKEVEFII